MEKQPRLGYDMDGGYWFDRSKPERLSEQPQTYQECDPIAMVAELEARIVGLTRKAACWDRVNHDRAAQPNVEKVYMNAMEWYLEEAELFVDHTQSKENQ